MKRFLGQIKIISALIILTIYGKPSFSQYYSAGAEQLGTRWYQIQTDHHTVLYPEGFDSIAQLYTRQLEYVYEPCGKSLEHLPRKIPVVLHNKTNISNAMVAWCPKQMTVYSFPSQTQHPQSWYENLAIHEYRHVVQTDKVDVNSPLWLRLLFGQQIPGALAGLYLPMWLLEGDAVCTETALSVSGRGRQPEFSMEMRAEAYEQGMFSYSKSYFGSYKDNVPNYYVMGYYFLANTRKLYGTGLESKILYNASKPLSIRPVNRAIREKTGMSKQDLYTSVFATQANEWKLRHDREVQMKYDTICAARKTFTNYINGHKYSDSLYYVERKGLDRTSQIISVDRNGKNHVIAETGFKPSDERVYSNGKTLVWVETHQHVRWDLRQTSYLYLYDIEHKKSTRIKTKAHVLSPAISPSDERVAVSEVDESGNNYLTLYDRKSRHIIKRILSPGNDQVINPSWDSVGSKIVYVGLGSQGKRLMEYQVQADTCEEVLPYTKEDYTAPQYWKEYILFTSSYSGVDNVYAYDRKTGATSRVTVADFGVRYPSTKDSTLIFSTYTSKGYQLAEMPLNPKHWHPIDVVRKDNYNLAQMLTNQEGGSLDFSQMPDTIYEAKRYSRLLHSLNIHSWSPLYYDYSNYAIGESMPGFKINSQNNLGNTLLESGYRYKFYDSEKRDEVFVNLIYTGLYPIFNVEYAIGRDRFYDGDEDYLRYRTQSLLGKMSLPYRFSSHSYNRMAIASAHIENILYTRTKCPRKYRNVYVEELSACVLSYEFSLSNTKKLALRDMYPRFGQSVGIGYLHSPFTTTTSYSDKAYIYGNLYLPGFMRSHSLRVYGGYEWNKEISSTVSILSEQITLPRGYVNDFGTYNTMYSFIGNYTLPIWYPDFQLSDIFYLKRISGTFFYDYARGVMQSTSQTATRQSVGAEFIADYHLLGFIAPFRTGVRISYIDDQQSPYYIEMLFSVNFSDI